MADTSMKAPRSRTLLLPRHGLALEVRHDGHALLGVVLREARSARRGSVPQCDLERRLAADLRRYFAGERVAFRYRLNLGEATPFQREVWRALRRIPRGEVRTYGWVAAAIGRPSAARAVGGACGANPWPIIVPCHRVVASDGSLGGYSAGLRWKRFLLRLEGAA